MRPETCSREAPGVSGPHRGPTGSLAPPSPTWTAMGSVRSSSAGRSQGWVFNAKDYTMKSLIKPSNDDLAHNCSCPASRADQDPQATPSEITASFRYRTPVHVLHVTSFVCVAKESEFRYANENRSRSREWVFPRSSAGHGLVRNYSMSDPSSGHCHLI